jgi:hypothetical protein
MRDGRCGARPALHFFGPIVLAADRACRPGNALASSGGENMAGKSRMSVLKRQRELQKAEKAQIKREQRMRRKTSETANDVATREDLESYGIIVDRGEDSRPR